MVVSDHVRWGDMDAYQHLNNTLFFRLFEQARMAYFERIHFSSPGDNDQIGPILAHTECHFLKPLTYPQALQIGTRVSHLDRDWLTMDYGLFFSADGQARLAACGTGKIVCYDYANGKRCDLPDSVVASIEALEKS